MTITGKSPNRMDVKPRLEQLKIRKALSLNSKDLVYYYPNESVPTPVEEVTIDEMYIETDTWFTLKVRLNNGDERNVHSDYFADMQRGKQWSEKSWPDA